MYNRTIWLAIALILILSAVSVSAQDTPKGKVLLVVTSHGQMGSTGHETGFWMSEMTHPYVVLTDAGFKVHIASINGGKAPIDPRSLEGDAKNDPANQRFLSDSAMMAKINYTIKLATVDPMDYDAVVFAGGHGTMWDFPESATVQNVIASVYQHNGVVAAVCHGPAALVNVKLDDGTPLLKGKKVTGFSNQEEKAVELDGVVPFMLETAMSDQGGVFSSADNWQSHVVVDGRLVTGQNPASAEGVGEAVVKLLNEKM